jgi:hypothetical protein
MAYKTTIAISANRANGRTADEGIESCSPYWIMGRGPSGTVGSVSWRPQSSSASRGRWKSRFFGFTTFSWFPRENTATDYQRDHCGQKIPSATLSSMVLSVAHRHCCIRQSGAVTRSFDAVGKSPHRHFRARASPCRVVAGVDPTPLHRSSLPQ